MPMDTPSEIAPFNAKFFPQHVLLLTVGENMMSWVIGR